MRGEVAVREWQWRLLIKGVEFTIMAGACVVIEVAVRW
jgi:hypothetical protein